MLPHSEPTIFGGMRVAAAWLRPPEVRLPVLRRPETPRGVLRLRPPEGSDAGAYAGSSVIPPQPRAASVPSGGWHGLGLPRQPVMTSTIPHEHVSAHPFWHDFCLQHTGTRVPIGKCDQARFFGSAAPGDC